MSDPVTAKLAATARAYLESQPYVLAAIRARREHVALLLQVSADVRDHYTAAIVWAVRSVTDVRLELAVAQRDAALVELGRVRKERAELRALWAGDWTGEL